MRDGQADGDRIVRAVDEVGAVAGRQTHGVQPERIVRARAAPRRQRIARRRVLLAHRLGRIPGRILAASGDDVREAERRAPVHLADADRIGDDLHGLAALRLGIVVQAMLGQIDHDAFTRTGRQNVPAGNRRSVLPAPGIHGSTPGIHTNQLLRAEAEFAREIVESVLVDRRGRFVAADHRVGGARQRRGRAHRAPGSAPKTSTPKPTRRARTAKSILRDHGFSTRACSIPPARPHDLVAAGAGIHPDHGPGGVRPGTGSRCGC